MGVRVCATRCRQNTNIIFCAGRFPTPASPAATVAEMPKSLQTGGGRGAPVQATYGVEARVKVETNSLVRVRAVDPSTTEETLSAFFTFCGPVRQIVMRPADDVPEQVAVVSFQHPTAIGASADWR